MGRSSSSLQLAFGLFLLMTIMLMREQIQCEASGSNMGCKPAERQALLRFKHSLQEDSMGRLSSWVGEDCCHWRGVTCDHLTGHVVKLDLHNKFLPQMALVSSRIDSALAQLKHLTHLDLSGNDFQGSPIPELIGSLTQLTYLGLSQVGLSGKVPPQLGNLTNLIVLKLSANLDDNFFEVDDLKWVSSVSQLRSLELGGMKLAQPNDVIQVLDRLPLSHLLLSNCGYTELSHAFTNSSSKLLSTLRHLELSGSCIEGPVPPSIGNLSSLRFLDLSINSFNGSLPLFLPKLKALQHLDLSDNEFNHVEGGIWGIIGSPCNFKFLDMSDNIISGELLEPPMNFSACTSYDLEHLDLSGNQISGNLPSRWGQFMKLNYLNLASNMFQGDIPASIARLSALKLLDLSNNSLNGVIPDFLARLTQLEHLDISSNSLKGTVSLSNLSKLSYWDTSSNTFSLKLGDNWLSPSRLLVFQARSCKINAPFPQWLQKQIRIGSLDLSDTGISGKLPAWLGNMSHLAYLDLSSNHISGSVPNLSANVGRLDLSYNYLTGSLPALQFGYMVYFDHNMLSGNIPYIPDNITVILFMDLSSNHLSGTIPPSLSIVLFLNLNSNNLDGSIPMTFFDNSNSIVLDLSKNKLSGNIPTGHGDSHSPKFLILRENNLSGKLPEKLCSLIDLQILDLANNNFHGNIPPCFGHFSSEFQDVNSDSSLRDVEQVIKRQTLKYSTTLYLVGSIDLSCNQLNGTIPEEITNLTQYVSLNLSNNHLIGAIPAKIGNMKSLESLDLSNNHLSGTLPQSLSALTSLSSLNVSHNNLHGQIPTGTQLQSFDPSAYTGNPGLWGCPLHIKCVGPHQPPPPAAMIPVVPGAGEDDEDKHEKMLFYLAIMLGLATGFWGVVGTLVLKKSWRHAFSHLVDDAVDWIYVQVTVRMNRLKKRLGADG